MGLNQARNDNELQALIMPALKEAVDYVVDRIVKDNEEIIQEVVYDRYVPVDDGYQRTGEFKEAWDNKGSKIKGNHARGEFGYDPDELTIGDLRGQHKSLNPDEGRDVRPYLAEIIYEGLAGAIYQEGYASDSSRFHGKAWTKKRDAWKALKKKLGKRTLLKYFEEGMAQAGLRFKHRRSSLLVFEDEE